MDLHPWGYSPPGRARPHSLVSLALPEQGWGAGSRGAPTSAPIPRTCFGSVLLCPTALGSAAAPFAPAPVLLWQRNKLVHRPTPLGRLPWKGHAGQSGEQIARLGQTGTSVACALCVRAAGAGAESSAQLCPFSTSVLCLNPAAALGEARCLSMCYVLDFLCNPLSRLL